MPRPGRLLMKQMRAAARWTEADAEDARRARRAGAAAVAAREIRYPTLTAENAGQAMEWQARAIAAYRDGDTAEALARRIA